MRSFGEASAHGFDGPFFIGKLARLELRVNQIAVDAQLERAAAGRD
jgi:hypothetical protein